jgi:hypothetical protein
MFEVENTLPRLRLEEVSDVSLIRLAVELDATVKPGRLWVVSWLK